MFRSVLLAACAVLALPLPASAQEAAGTALEVPPIAYDRWQLPNGLTVIALRDPSTATVTTSLWYDVGAKNDPEGRSGFAHLFEHILSRKTENMPYNLIYSLVADVGGTRNASTSPDRTNYFETVPAEYLETMLWTHRERMALPVIDDHVFESERGVVKEELRTRVLAPPYGILQRFVVPEAGFDLLPQRRPSIGVMADLDAATLDDARAFHQAYYGPDTATLIVAGNFDPANLRALVERYFADIPPRTAPVDVAIAAREPGRTAPRTIVARAPGVPLPVVATLWQLPGAAHPDMPALEVLGAIMARGESSRAYLGLVLPGLAVETEAYVDTAEEGSLWLQSATVSAGADPAVAAQALAAVTAALRDRPVSTAELAEAKAELVADSLRGRETARGRAFELGEYLVMTGDPQAADRRLAGIAAVSVEDVQRVARLYLAPDARTDITYASGPHDPAEYANPVPMPQFVTLPPPTGAPRVVLPDGERQPPPAAGERPAVAVPAIARSRLANGLEVIATQTGDVPLVTLSVLLPGGSASDPRGQAGLANLAALLAGKGTSHADARNLARRLEGLGADLSSVARSDGTVFILTAPRAGVAEAGAILADMIRNPTYPADEVAREKARTIDGLSVAMREPGSLAGMAMRPLLYGAAPYGTVGGGTPESLAAITREDLLAHAHGWWRPAGTQVVVTGGIAPEDAFALVQGLLGDWQPAGSPAPAPVADRAGPPQPVRTVVIDMPDAGQAAVVLAARGPSRRAEDAYALDLANAVLGVGANGRLFEEIRTRRSLSYGAYSSIGSTADDPAIVASAQTANATADEVAAVMLEQFARLGAEPLDADTVARRRLLLAGGRARALETGAGYGGVMLDLLAQGIDPAEVSRYAERLDAASAAAASAAGAHWFDPARTSLLIVGNAAEFIDDLRAIRPDVEVIPVAELDLASATLR
ncbi:insulinase family protein [Altererythrobacter buctensis]|uniref:Insulinase family protein n=2 Tax=Alteraurantiacibacter buctensis TaxID=1503981 RepID=A0A844Z1S7_9SPHN|nr:insulinase family protein [Alteraurantiacibacter buctensis]